MPSPGMTASRMARVTGGTGGGSVSGLAAVVAPVQRLLDGVAALLVLAHKSSDGTRAVRTLSRHPAADLEYRDSRRSVREVHLARALRSDRVDDLGEHGSR